MKTLPSTFVQCQGIPLCKIPRPKLQHSLTLEAFRNSQDWQQLDRVRDEDDLQEKQICNLRIKIKKEKKAFISIIR